MIKLKYIYQDDRTGNSIEPFAKDLFELFRATLDFTSLPFHDRISATGKHTF